MSDYMENNVFNSYESVIIFVVSGGFLTAYLSAALNQIPNIPENANLRKHYEKVFEQVVDAKLENDYLKGLSVDYGTDITKVSEDKIVDDLVNLVGCMNQNTKYLQLNYKQMIGNRLKKFEITEDRIKEINEKSGKPATKKESEYLLQIAAMHDVYQFLSTTYRAHSGKEKDAESEEMINQNNHYNQHLNNGDLVKDFSALLDAGENSMIKFINFDRKDPEGKVTTLLNPEVLYFNENGKVDKEWQIHLISHLMQSKFFGDNDLRKCLAMELLMQKSFNDFLGKLATSGYDVNKILVKVQKNLIEKERADALKETEQSTETKNVVPMQQTAGKVASTNNVETQKKKSQFIQLFMKLRATKNEQEQGK